NLCVRTVGALLINALLVVPAATACNLARNLRQLFWLTTVLCLTACLAGPLIAWEGPLHGGPQLSTPGTIILASIGLFLVSAFVGPWLKQARRRTAPPPAAPPAPPVGGPA